MEEGIKDVSAINEEVEEDKQEKLKQEVLSIATGLLTEAGYGSLKKGILYNVIIDHIAEKMFREKSLYEADESDVDFALAKMEEIRSNFTPAIIAGIIRDSNATTK